MIARGQPRARHSPGLASTIGLVLLIAGCASGTDEASDPSGDASRRVESIDAAFPFTDVTAAAGIDFVHENDASEDRLLPETMGAGVAFCDLDGDDLADIFLLNGTSLSVTGPGSTGRYYRNRGDGGFDDVTIDSGLDVALYAMGVAAGDVDGDGHADLLITAVGQDRLFRNDGHGRFTDVTSVAGLDDEGEFSTSAVFFDPDRDGDLDIFVCRYVAWSAETDRPCRPDGIHRAYCTPESYGAIANRFWRNDGSGDTIRFTDVTVSSGIGEVAGKALGVVVLDHDEDGWPDLIVANDTERNFLFHNRGDGTFDEVGAERGVAYGESGAARGGMGIDAADLDGDGRDEVVIGNFAHEMSALFRSSASGMYLDAAPVFGLGIPTLSTLAFGVRLVDLDGDGWDDAVIVNGHIEPLIETIYPGQVYAQRPQIFRNSNGQTLKEVGSLGDASVPLVGRGLAIADYDQDGDPDLLMTQNGRRAVLYRNEAAPSRRVRLRLVPRAERPIASATRIQFRGDAVPPSAADRRLLRGGSYLSASDPLLTFGLSSETVLDSLVVDWTSGARSVVSGAELAKELVVVRESVGSRASAVD